MVKKHTSLGKGETWMPQGGAAEDFIGAYTSIAEQFYSRKLQNCDLETWRENQLSKVLEKVKQKSPFYRSILSSIDLTEVSPKDMTALPFTTKEDLRREMFNVLSGDVSEALYYYETTGTTGKATPCPRDGKEIIASNSHVTESWRAIFAHHFGDHKPSVGLMGPTEVHSFGDTLGDVAKNLGSCNAKIWPYSPVIGFPKALQLMRDLKLEVLVATPGVCLNLARAAQKYGYDISRDFSSLKLFFVTGEMCTPALARNIETLWNVKAYNILYGSQEAFVMGAASPSGKMRFADLNYICELIDPDTGEYLGEYGTGELCVTMLADGIKPLIRYRTGDLVRISPDDGNQIDQPGKIIDIIGRALDRVALGSKRYTAGTIEQVVLEGVEHCYGYQIVIDNRGGNDHLTVKLQFDNAVQNLEMLKGQIAERVRAQLDVAAEVEIVDALDDIVSTGAFVSWKAARIVDHRISRTPEEKVAESLSRKRGI